jgi:hypothetical protein
LGLEAYEKLSVLLVSNYAAAKTTVSGGWALKNDAI